ncbi:outer membrane lipoprotein-sorting protein [Chitinophaga nivalis]|uniref:Outer membrane lipoprotein-sorting protein n=1 Tax=Chitinophaga nivalis TaxID=2991709 RepID=A0ABT3IMW3_9BACT|nr:outer membrane lipoprotein-sorting protein [Chitinophaga nivalis]MCW3465002.1 outer membrane lipoprotein-sorting protein [Chitinophaga nivalis]MCW3485306.1 outer membrane lipoprotein-sorting protein [Chitinophaga nivalis]
MIYRIKCCLLLLLWPAFLAAQSIEEGAALLREAELKRQPWPVMTSVIQLDDNGPAGHSTHLYHVFYNADKVLLAYMSPAESGNLLLMVKDGLWFYTKDTRMPTRITPMQKMSGSVSYGDLTNLSWKDYVVTAMENTTYENTAAHLLHLAAKNKSATYQKVDLWINKANKRPITAVSYLLSGKKYKTIRYTKYNISEGKDVNTQILFTDHFNKDRESTVDFVKIKSEQQLPNRYFIKTALPEISNEICK